MARIAIIMPTYNEERRLLSQAIDSILQQTVADFELVVIIDNPDHKSNDYLETIALEDERITLVHNDENIGLAASLNKALDLVDSEYIARMDADDISCPNRLEIQLRYLEGMNASLVGSQLSVIDETGAALYDTPQIPLAPEKVSRALRFNNCVPHPSWFGKAELFKLGYRQIPLCEDYDLLLRAALLGMRIGNVGQKLVQYRMTSNSVSRTNLYTQFRYQKYLSKCYAHGQIADIDKAAQYANSKNDAKRREKYCEANARLNQTLELLREKHYGKAAMGVIPLITKSASYNEKMLRFALASRVGQ
ncbi:MAG: glycosyltransferase [Coriobacteriaceae bacterium]|nr:glycosyltransferase [Coriobacteriaceae bacterium]